MIRKSTLAAAMLGFVMGCTPVDNTPPMATDAPASGSKNTLLPVESFTLDNGLDVVFHIDRSDPVVAVNLAAHVGSSNEIEGRTGFAHLFEHLLFLESENLGKGGLDKLSAKVGGSGANGFTTRDMTVYEQTIPKDALEKFIWAEADRLGYFINTVTQGVLDKEKQVVKNEKRQRVDNRPYGHGGYVISKNLYPEGHPYSWEVIGSLEDIQNATLKDVKNFYKRWYAPNNVTLTLAGDFDPIQTRAWIEKYFADVKRGEALPPVAAQPISLSTSKTFKYEDNFARLPQLTMVWPTVEKYHPDEYALNALERLLTNGKKSVFNQVVVEQDVVAPQVSSFHYPGRLTGEMRLTVRAFKGIDLDDVQTSVNKAFSTFENSGFNEQDLERVKAQMETEFYQRLSSVQSKARAIAFYNAYLSQPGYAEEELRLTMAVTADDVWRVYNQYLKDKPFVSTSFVPKGQDALALEGALTADVVEESIGGGTADSFDLAANTDIPKTFSSFDRSEEPPYGESFTLASPVVWQQSLTNGVEVYGLSNDELPLVEFQLILNGGQLFEQEGTAGTANFVARMLNKGTASKTTEELEGAIQQLGSAIRISASKTEIYLAGRTLARNFPQTMALATEMLLEPRWDEGEFETLKLEIDSSIEGQQASPNAIANNRFDELMYGADSPLSKPLIGTKASIADVTLEDLKGYYSRNISPNLASLHVVGDVEQSQVAAALSQLQDQWPNQQIALPQLADAGKPGSRLYFYNVNDAKQSELRIGYPAIKATDLRIQDAEFVNYRLGGGSFVAQLTQQLREAKGYTYGIRSRFDADQHRGRFIISSAVRTDATFDAIQLINDIVSDYTRGYDQTDLDVTKGYFLKSSARRLESLGAKLNLLINISQLDYPTDYLQQRQAKYEQYSLDLARRVSAEFIRPEQLVYLVVGDAKTQLKPLEELGLGTPVLVNP